jgi:hypothetical protein
LIEAPAASPARRAWLIGIALLLMAAAAWRFGQYRGERERLVASVAPLLATSQESATILDRLRREPDVEQARVLAARALVRQVLADTSALGRTERLDRLALARQLAADALAARPANWGASTLLGASTYLGWSIARDNRLLMSAPAWEGPLWRATVLGPSRSEPARFLAMAYLELWPTLPENKREEARDLLRRGFEDRETFDRLIGAWLATADEVEEALALIPPDPHAWSLSRSLLGQRRDWRGYELATERWHQVLAADFARAIEEAEDRLAAGDVLDARGRLLVVLREMPTDRRYAETFIRVMHLLPAGLADSLTERILSRWLAWASALARTGDCPLPSEVIDRLARTAPAATPAEEAEIALLAGRLDHAERIEAQAAESWGPEWAFYRIAKSRLLTERGRVAAARAELDQVDPSLHGTAAYWSARTELERAAGDDTALGWASSRLEALRSDHWPAAAWARRSLVSRLTLFSPAAGGLELSLDEVPIPGLAIAVRWDGLEVAVVPVDAGGPLVVAAEIRPGRHLLELEALGGAEVTPGAVRLLSNP